MTFDDPGARVLERARAALAGSAVALSDQRAMAVAMQRASYQRRASHATAALCGEPVDPTQARIEGTDDALLADELAAITAQVAVGSLLFTARWSSFGSVLLTLRLTCEAGGRTHGHESPVLRTLPELGAWARQMAEGPCPEAVGGAGTTGGAR